MQRLILEHGNEKHMGESFGGMRPLGHVVTGRCDERDENDNN